MYFVYYCIIELMEVYRSCVHGEFHVVVSSLSCVVWSFDESDMHIYYMGTWKLCGV